MTKPRETLQRLHWQANDGKLKSKWFANLDAALTFAAKLVRKEEGTPTCLQNSYDEIWSNPEELMAIAQMRNAYKPKAKVIAEMERIEGYGSW